jgi:CRISPR-associated protein Csb1
MTKPLKSSDIDRWVEPDGPVALHLKQKLRSVEDDGKGGGAVLFPPTYVDIGYNIDTLSDGTKVCTIDSVGSEANRMEPIFKVAEPGEQENALARLVPQVDIAYGNEKKISLLDVGHRLGDAIIRTSTSDTFDLPRAAKEAFEEFQLGDATKLAKLAPTSLVFGAWDSRQTGTKIPRMVQSVIRAWNVDVLKRSAVYTAPIDYVTHGVFDAGVRERAEKDEKRRESRAGYVNALATGTHGGVVAHGPIQRDVTINLIALRRLKGGDSIALRRYILGLALVAATEPIDGFLRAGCLLALDPDVPSEWTLVHRDGKRAPVAIEMPMAREFAERATKAYEKGPDRLVTFSRPLAQADIARFG